MCWASLVLSPMCSEIHSNGYDFVLFALKLNNNNNKSVTLHICKLPKCSIEEKAAHLSEDFAFVA